MLKYKKCVKNIIPGREMKQVLSLSRERKKVVGTKETLKAINNCHRDIIKVFIAEDIDQRLKEQLLQAVKRNNIPVETVDSRLKLGRACGIDISAACAALLK